jgi:outer membrane protein
MKSLRNVYRYSLHLGLLTAFLLCHQALCRPLQLKDAVLLALESSPSIDFAKKTHLIRKAEYKNAVFKLLPSLDLTTTHGLQTNIPFGPNSSFYISNPSAPWYGSISLTLNESLYDNGVSWTQMSIAELNQEVALLSQFKSRDDLVLKVAEEFYRFSRAMALVEVRKQQQDILQKQFKTLSEQYYQGLKVRSDFLRFKSQLQRAEIDSLSSKNAIQLSLNEIRKLIGKNDFENETPDDVLQFEPILIKKDEKMKNFFPKKKPKIKEFYDYKIIKLKNEINNKSVVLAKRNYWPQALLSAGVTYYNQNYLNSSLPFNEGNQISWNVLLSLNYNFWDWGIRRRDIEIAQYNRDVQFDTLQQELIEQDLQINNLLLEVSRNEKSFSMNRELLEIEEQTYQRLETQYREGKVAYLDLITGLKNLLDAKEQFYTSYFDVLQNFARYKYFEGKVYETIFEE